MNVCKVSSILFGLVLVGFCFAAQAPKQINHGYKTIEKLMSKKDIKGLTTYIKVNSAPGFTYSEKGRTMGLNTFIQHLQAGMSEMTKVLAAKVKATKFVKVGHAASGNVSMMIKFIAADSKGGKHTIEAVQLTRDTWRQVGPTWKLASIQDISTKMKMDGKPMPMMSPQR